MPAKSRSQQRLMGMVYAVKMGKLSPHKVSERVRQMAAKMKYSDAEDFAKTKHKGLPGHVKKAYILGLTGRPMFSRADILNKKSKYLNALKSHFKGAPVIDRSLPETEKKSSVTAITGRAIKNLGRKYLGYLTGSRYENAMRLLEKAQAGVKNYPHDQLMKTILKHTQDIVGDRALKTLLVQAGTVAVPTAIAVKMYKDKKRAGDQEKSAFLKEIVKKAANMGSVTSGPPATATTGMMNLIKNNNLEKSQAGLWNDTAKSMGINNPVNTKSNQEVVT
jgi:hypothetical protein